MTAQSCVRQPFPALRSEPQLGGESNCCRALVKAQQRLDFSH